ncbi:hypothetical protein ACM66B_003294 [Microbotryomycetes sp. NB124-2]
MAGRPSDFNNATYAPGDFRFSFNLPHCPQPHVFSKDEACDLLENGFGGLYLRGDSLVRHLTNALFIILRDRRDGATADKALQQTCWGDRMFDDKKDCRHKALVNSLDPALSAERVCTGRLRLNYQAELCPTAGASSFLERLTDWHKRGHWTTRNVSPVVVQSFGLHCGMLPSIAAFGSLKPLLAYARTAFPRPLSLWLGIHAPGANKPPQFLDKQGHDPVLRYNFAVEQTLDDIQPLKEPLHDGRTGVLDFFGMTDGAESFDGTHYMYQVNMEKAHLLLNYLDVLWGEVRAAGGLPPVEPTHNPQDADAPPEWLPWSTFFDLDRFRSEQGTETEDWASFLSTDLGTSLQQNGMACWSPPTSRARVRFRDNFSGETVRVLEYPMSESAGSRQLELLTYDGILDFDALWRSNRLNVSSELAVKTWAAHTEGNRETPIPMTDMLCLLMLYYVVDPQFANHQFNGGWDVDEPAWSAVGQHLHFSPTVRGKADELVASILGASDKPYVGIHMRRGDFMKNRLANITTAQVLDMYAAELASLIATQDNANALSKLPVIVATDSEEEDFQSEIRARGWNVLIRDSIRRDFVQHLVVSGGEAV